MAVSRKSPILAAAFLALAACTAQQRDKADSAAGALESLAATELSVIDVDMGRHADSAKKITDKTDTFAASDTIHASVHMSGTAKQGQVTASWTFPDGSVIRQEADSAVTTRDYLLFFLTRPDGLAKGKYTFRVMVDGREVRSKDVTVS